jgi:hypothetical protein
MKDEKLELYIASLPIQINRYSNLYSIIAEMECDFIAKHKKEASAKGGGGKLHVKPALTAQ